MQSNSQRTVVVTVAKDHPNTWNPLGLALVITEQDYAITLYDAITKALSMPELSDAQTELRKLAEVMGEIELVERPTLFQIPTISIHLDCDYSWPDYSWTVEWDRHIFTISVDHFIRAARCHLHDNVNSRKQLAIGGLEFGSRPTFKKLWNTVLEHFGQKELSPAAA